MKVVAWKWQVDRNVPTGSKCAGLFKARCKGAPNSWREVLSTNWLQLVLPRKGHLQTFKLKKEEKPWMCQWRDSETCIMKEVSAKCKRAGKAENLPPSWWLLFAAKVPRTPSGEFSCKWTGMGRGPQRKSEDFQARSRKYSPNCAETCKSQLETSLPPGRLKSWTFLMAALAAKVPCKLSGQLSGKIDLNWLWSWKEIWTVSS